MKEEGSMKFLFLFFCIFWGHALVLLFYPKHISNCE